MAIDQPAGINRRRFLRDSSVAGAAPLAAAQVAPGRKPLLITSGASRLAQALASGLKEKYAIRLTERIPVRTEHEFFPCALDPDAATSAAVHGVEAIVHTAEPLPEETAQQQIDLLTRCTYNLLWAAAAEAVPRVILLSTLELMTGYPANFTVGETWRPRPSLQPPVLAKHLCEFTSREFAREGKISVVVLRLGKVVRAGEVSGQAVDPLWVEERDVVHAVACALTAKAGPWQVYHIQADSAGARFAVTRAKSALGYRPQFHW